MLHIGQRRSGEKRRSRSTAESVADATAELIMGQDPISLAMNHTWEILRELVNSIDIHRRPPVVPTIDLEDIVQWFVSNTPASLHVTAGGLLRRSRPDGDLIYQFFLDDQNAPCTHPNGTPYGRRFITKSIGPELAPRLVEGNDLVIFT